MYRSLPASTWTSWLVLCPEARRQVADPVCHGLKLFDDSPVQHHCKIGILLEDAAEQLAIQPQILYGQPPFDHSYDDVTYRWRFLFAEAGDASINNRHYEELRWVPRQSLREYEFDPVSQQVVDWMLEE